MSHRPAFVFLPPVGASLLFLLAATSAVADTFRVGAGAGCTHATLALAVAAAAANGPASDYITLPAGSIALSGRIEIQNQEVAVSGGSDGCAPIVPVGRTTITHAGPDEAFWVHGTSHSFIELSAVDVVLGSDAGRGFTIEGRGWVSLVDATVSGGQAPDGGNIWIGGPDTHLGIYRSSVTSGLAASGDGGGIYCEEGADLTLGARSKVTDNKASASGGGLFVDGCSLQIEAYLDGLPGESIEISRNEATTGDGGGISAVGNAFVYLVGWPAAESPLFVSDNYAGGDGGGIHLAGKGMGPTVELYCVDVSDNRADGYGGGILYVGETGAFKMAADPDACPGVRGGSKVSGNRAGEDGGGLAVGLGMFYEARVTQTAIFGNYNTTASTGAAVFAGGAGLVLLEGCEIYDNDPNGDPGGVETARLAASSGELWVAFSTIVEQTTGVIPVFQNAGAAALNLLSSIVQAPTTFAPEAPTTFADCVVVSESATLPGGASTFLVVTDPAALFRLSTPDDFSLRRNSEAQDYCDTFYYTPITTDIDGQLRGFDDAFPNELGPYDLGADEWRPEIFADGFESGDIYHW